MDFDDPRQFDDPQVLEGMDFDNPKSYVDTSIFDGLVELRNV